MLNIVENNLLHIFIEKLYSPLCSKHAWKKFELPLKDFFSLAHKKDHKNKINSTSSFPNKMST
jgi:hypothetical protein